VIGKKIAFVLLAQKPRCLKTAGIEVFHHQLAPLARSDLPAIERLFVDGHLAGETLVDLFAMQVLQPLLHYSHQRLEVVDVFASWRDADTVAQRRAALVALCALAAQGDTALPGLVRRVLAVCSTVVWSIEPGDQTAVGLLLHQLSHAEAARVDAFVRRHARFMSRACVRLSIERLPAARQQDLLAHWKRATTLRR
jgi:hypothetical protein